MGQNIFLLKGKTALVTGGAGLLGRAIVKALSESGAKVIVVDIDLKGCKEICQYSSGGKVVYENCDITDIENIAANVQRIEAKHGSVDIWVNSAYPRTKDWGDKLEKVKQKSWQKNVDMQLNSYCLISNEIARRMAKRASGCIVNIASIYGVVAPDFTIYDGTDKTSPAAYSAIKGGMVAYSKYLASYYRGTGVRINVVCPGGILNNQPVKFIKNYSKKTLLGRMAKPEEIAWPVVFLASEAASYITGAVLMVDGGWTTI